MADEFADIWDEEGTDLDVAMKSSQRAEDKLFKAGFRESAADEDDGRFESGFRAGFKEAITRGLYWGQLKGKAHVQGTLDEKKFLQEEKVALSESKEVHLKKIESNDTNLHFNLEEDKKLTIEDLLKTTKCDEQETTSSTSNCHKES